MAMTATAKSYSTLAGDIQKIIDRVKAMQGDELLQARGEIESFLRLARVKATATADYLGGRESIADPPDARKAGGRAT
jgi:hypothetical protein